MKIVLTFDIERDIPGVFNSFLGVRFGLSKILELLDEFNIKGTFFCTGTIIQSFPEYIKLIESKKHEIGCHSFSHERLNRLDYDTCLKSIRQNKRILEKYCQRSEIIGFRAPYLKPPLFLNNILAELGFRYDSSSNPLKKLKGYQFDDSEIREFPPSNLNAFLRLPLNLRMLFNRIYKRELTILYFHPWEAINMKTLILDQKSPFIRYKNLLFRPDRWFKTGDEFIYRLRAFITRALSRNLPFVTLKDLVERRI
ncbi:MAG: polysaccharide deacetylase family protein [Promethearchaeota archaeon]|jgi:peptidoglycan/xylan/chitin deacetylase (PgdA/CDA1 family)